jgi:hypothetical protein
MIYFFLVLKSIACLKEMNTIKIQKLQTIIVNILNSLGDEAWNFKYQILLLNEDDVDFEIQLKQFANIVVENLQNKEQKTNDSDDEIDTEQYHQLIRKLNYKTNNFFIQNEDILLPVDSRNFVKLIVGHVQSGKTSVICALATFNAIINKRSTVVIVRNLVGDYKQLRANFEGDGKFAEFGIEILFAGNKKDKFNVENVGNAIVATKPCIVIAIANHTEVKTLNDIIENRGADNVDFDLVLDECDDLGYKKLMTSKYIQEFTRLKNYSTQLFGITATAFDVMFMENELKSGKVYRLERPIHYKGVEQITFVHTDVRATFRKNTMNNDMVEMYLQIQRNRFHDAIRDPEEKYYQDHPNVVLCKISALTDQHEKMIMAFATMKKLQVWTCLTYNGQGVSLYSRYLVNEESMIINGILGTKNEAGIWSFPGLQIGAALQELRNRDPNAEMFANINIASGRLASRGINFVSNVDYKWHLTHQILTTSESSTISDLIQSIRLCGVYKYDNIPLTLYTPQKDINDLRSSCVLHEELISGLIENPDENSFVKDLYANIPVFTDLIPKRKITNKTKKPIFNAIPRPIEDEDDEESGNIINVPRIDSPLYTTYTTIKNFLETRRGEWILLKDLRRFVEDGRHITLHDRSNSYGNRGMIWKQPGGTNSPIYYRLN